PRRCAHVLSGDDAAHPRHHCAPLKLSGRRSGRPAAARAQSLQPCARLHGDLTPDRPQLAAPRHRPRFPCRTHGVSGADRYALTRTTAPRARGSFPAAPCRSTTFEYRLNANKGGPSHGPKPKIQGGCIMTLVEPKADATRVARVRAPDVDIATTRPGTLGGTFMRQFWMALDNSANLATGRAKPIRIMSEDYTLYRGASGKAQVIAQRCPHRGAMMHLGWVEDDDIRCVYHGWKFDCTGQCIEQPAEEAGYNRKVKIATYPTREHMGLIFAYFGGCEPPPFPPYPESAGEGLIDPWPVYEVPCNYLQCFENSMDEVHVAFTHAPGGSHAKLSQDLPVISAEEKDWGILRFGKRASGKVRHTLHYAPNIVRVIVPPL